jgi:hypothetical protein
MISDHGPWHCCRTKVAAKKAAVITFVEIDFGRKGNDSYFPKMPISLA